jgi:phosphoglycerate dehydrogenase-like enzyme
VLAIRRDTAQPDPHRLAFLRGPAAVDEVLGRADYLAITLSLTADTRGLIGARQLALMKPTAVLVNVARGEVVDEDALYDALNQGRIAGAALDVWVSLPGGRRAGIRATARSRAAERADDAPRVRLDGG